MHQLWLNISSIVHDAWQDITIVGILWRMAAMEKRHREKDGRNERVIAALMAEVQK